MSTAAEAIRRLRRDARRKKLLLGIALALGVLVILLALNAAGLLVILDLAVKFVVYAGAAWTWIMASRRLDRRVEEQSRALMDEAAAGPPAGTDPRARRPRP